MGFIMGFVEDATINLSKFTSFFDIAAKKSDLIRIYLINSPFSKYLEYSLGL